MTNSMTAFARQQSEQKWGSLVWEIRSVNHRYLETSFRLPDSLRHLEHKFRELLRSSLSRGKVEAQLKFLPSLSTNSTISINQDLLLQLKEASKQIQAALPDHTNPSTLDVLKWPGLIQEQEHELEAKKIEEQALSLFESSLKALQAHRQREGAQLEELIEQRLDSISKIVDQLRTDMPKILQARREKLLEQFSNLEITLDPSRLEQEIVLLTQKADIEEEVDRLDTHVKEVKRNLSHTQPVGRRLDFLMQELNREANTVCSKAIVTDITLGAVDLKVLIEQMREQIQNIE